MVNVTVPPVTVPAPLVTVADRGTLWAALLYAAVVLEAVVVVGAVTVSVPLPAVAVPPFVEVGVTLLTIDPVEVPVMLTVTEQLPPGDRLVPLMLTLLLALADPDGQPTTFKFDGDATAKPAGRVSTNPTLFSVRLLFVLDTVMVIVLVPFSGMLVGLKDLASTGGLITVRVADDGEVAFPAVEESMVTLSV
jgi:hypothetical protein